ncbi:hypothetical protein BRC81_11550 [Halobacteriales archaeon QS_1_68_20]|nr:MAG: hypothetical protein BRC81_11550 [Halobacteriales archaeon QS_1_68_20]
MRTVCDETGRQYLLLKESGESSLVRDPASGERRYVANDELSPATGESPLATAARAVPDPVRRLVTAVRDERTLGLLVELNERGPLAVRGVVGGYDLCESDVHGALAEFQAAGLVDETEVAGERGYELTGDGEAAVELLQR